jgi:hypothetical protein
VGRNKLFFCDAGFVLEFKAQCHTTRDRDRIMKLLQLMHHRDGDGLK